MRLASSIAARLGIVVFSAVACAPAASRRPAPVPASTVVVLVRHAEKVLGADPDPALTDAGTARADALAARPEVACARAAYVTQFRRTALTAAPLAARQGVAQFVRPIAGDVGVYAAALAAEIRARPAGDTVLVVGHSNTVPAIVAALGGPRLPNIDDAEYARMFVVTLDARGTAVLRELTYGAPSAMAPGRAAAMPAGRPR
jgi:broad specificity phosphatase PhoE